MSDQPTQRRRTGITRFIGNVLDDAKDFTDECLDRARDLEHDVRKAISKAVRPDKDDEETVATVTAGRGTVRQRKAPEGYSPASPGLLEVTGPGSDA
ncbi:hypothetical protein ACH4PU_36005 [Streptomyces sp. NPDC021100]|uniref:hypothetical protein n=1 Tax=Streptomyces sp. NPDC021100 TaxID=3365114 RepID=UPI0037A591AC